MPDDISAEHWRAKANEEVIAAQAMARAGLWAQSFYRAGFAVECALKFRIMRSEGLNRWPDKEDRRHLWTHNLQHLLEATGLQSHLLAAHESGDPIYRHWLVAKDWKIEIRYDPRPFPPARGRDMLDAIVDGGLIKWLMTR
jgi:hypothetical protein